MDASWTEGTARGQNGSESLAARPKDNALTVK
jgi:hypothetical protein